MRKIAGGNGDFEFGDEEDIFSTVSEFGVTESGDYTFYLRDSDGCLDSITERVEVYGKPQLEFEILQEALCEEPVGEVSLIGTEGVGPLSYAEEGGVFTSDNIFGDLSSGETIFLVRDTSDCTTEVRIDIAATPRVGITDLATEQLFCGDVLSEVSFTGIGGTGTLSYSLTDSQGNLVDETDGLPEGQYRLTLTDEVGCEMTEIIIIRKEECQVYIPTIFNPVADGDNQTFKVGVPEQSEFFIESFQIYDRWGNLVYNKEDIDPLTFMDWWDGTYKGAEVQQGVYVYVIELAGEKVEIINGTITIVR